MRQHVGLVKDIQDGGVWCGAQETGNHFVKLVVRGTDVGRWVADDPIIALTNPTGLCVWWGLHRLWTLRYQKAVRRMEVNSECCYGNGGHLQGGTSLVQQHRATRSGANGEEAINMVLLAWATYAGGGPANECSRAASREGHNGNGGIARGTREALQGPEKGKCPEMQAGEAADPTGCLGPGGNGAGYVGGKALYDSADK